MTACEIASEGDLPHRVDRSVLPVDIAELPGEREVPSSWGGHRRERKAPIRARPNKLRFASFGREWVEGGHATSTMPPTVRADNRRGPATTLSERLAVRGKVRS